MSNYFSQRRNKLKRRLKDSNLNAMLVTNAINVTYLTGFRGDSSYLLVTPRKTLLLSDSRYTTQIEEQCPELDAEIRTAATTMNQVVSDNIATFKVSQLAIESDSMTKSEFDELDASIEAQLIDTQGFVEELRAIKDRSEIDKIRVSIRTAQRAFAVIRSQLTLCQTETAIAHNLEHQIRSFGGERCAFDPIVGIGARSALPHAEVTDQQIGSSPFFLLDWGANVDGYLSDLTRNFVTGRIPPKYEQIYKIVLRAQLAAIDKIRPGNTFKQVDSTARRVIARAGFVKNFGHGLGHGFGLEIHESPRLAPISSGKLEAGMVVTVEPGIYLPGFAGVRIEDDVLVTKDGHEVLSDLPKDFDSCFVDCN